MKWTLRATCAFLIVAAGGMPSRALTPPVPERAPGLETLPVPLPDRNPMRLEPEPPPPPPHPSEIEAPAWTAQEIEEARLQCAMMLDDTGIEFRYLEPLREGVCGTPAPVELTAVGKNPSVAIEPAATVTCGLAATLGAWADGTLQPAARKHLGDPVTAIRNVASYVCRNRYNASGKPISEHARANALDMAAFRTESGKWIAVLDRWALPPQETPEAEMELASSAAGTAPAAKPAVSNSATVEPVPLPVRKPPVEKNPEFGPEAAFLLEIHTGACALFGTVLGPLANDAHKDHFHYDLAERKHGNYCE